MRNFILVIAVSVLFGFTACSQETKTSTKHYKVEKTDAEWQKELTSSQYTILRKAGTERAFSSPLNKNYEKGTYTCAACNTPLYRSEFKFDSGTGWPSFDRAVDKNIEYDKDYKIGYARTELKCAICAGHLGHLFKDGPSKTGNRHCINGAALKFIPQKD
jgi:peptide-methionine (R)-S-oxide reductase